jgi:hypothetical protein
MKIAKIIGILPQYGGLFPTIPRLRLGFCFEVERVEGDNVYGGDGYHSFCVPLDKVVILDREEGWGKPKFRSNEEIKQILKEEKMETDKKVVPICENVSIKKRFRIIVYTLTLRLPIFLQDGSFVV